MRILLHRRDGVYEDWLAAFAHYLPEAQVVVWEEGKAIDPCDYAVLFVPPPGILADLAKVKAIFCTGAGVDALLKLGEQLPPVPIVRLADAGMGVQMAEYVTHAVLRYYRRFDDYQVVARQGLWEQLPAYDKQDFTVGVLGAGALGSHVIGALRHFGFPLRAWSRTPKDLSGVACYHGPAQLDSFLQGLRVVVCMLPLTPDTANLLDRARLSLLAPGGYVINVARGGLLAEPDLLALITAGQLAGATLDVFRNEPLPPQHPFWQEPRITITPHISALTLCREAVEQISGKIRAMARGELVADIVNRTLGY
ncbi:glyoxylate/hydroxypyruvate reductase A [Massilia sp. TS11]|uniref:2-hydroxyacid dehydrogenase n=1 Tax=Massilia sp. TS11 TaxID=2908003 RepID=UPI001EDC3B7E|nr:glyoxylate/hydroxypyruvate reductase A [Massilia sp. TS11]MCG2585174.1 glyoxylate/hydroxypyruvate reductase A [Massilia sp. TS11]